jgi:hypothetical protein
LVATQVSTVTEYKRQFASMHGVHVGLTRRSAFRHASVFVFFRGVHQIILDGAKTNPTFHFGKTHFRRRIKQFGDILHHRLQPCRREFGLLRVFVFGIDKLRDCNSVKTASKKQLYQQINCAMTIEEKDKWLK